LSAPLNHTIKETPLVTRPHLPSLFVTATDTGVGKTVVAALLGLIYQEAGLRPAYFKPVETAAAKEGAELLSRDASFVAGLLELQDEPQKMLCPYAFELPVSPHLAASLAKKQVKLENICECYRYFERRYHAVIVEGAGGLLVPVSPTAVIADIARELGLPLLIVARPGLSTINHTLLTIAAALRADLPVIGVVLNRYPENPDLVEKDNPKAIADFSGVPVLATVPEIPDFDPARPDYAALIAAARRVNETHRLAEKLAAFSAERQPGR